ncbi:DUF488 family protein [Candidatus Protochlamydia phocaeensis]|uniref:DUF488 domain-containing protein n=1 Tax=Candidatus Protochlamydia phocaeensis TaxID=1414722 RepID=UPI00083859DD|nr:DUF488 domain-containing protein [Candidatus Protochlamydia phocaeensis]
MPNLIYTIGHSNRSLDAFLDLLKAYEIEMLIDVRRYPYSKHNPQFNQDCLASSLPLAHVLYTHLIQLGGRRSAHKNSLNREWRHPAFRGYADYMQTDGFKEGLEQLEKLGIAYKSAIMCSEALPWRCHRSLIADALTIRHWQVLDIFSSSQAKPHQLTSFLRMKEGKLFYPSLKDQD